MRPISSALASDVAKFNQASWKWLLGRVDFMRRNKSIPGAINKTNYVNPRMFLIGELFLYHYDPKWKDVLPYYDKFPLVIPLQLYNDGFLGLNLHYLPPNVRIAFLNKLMALATVAPGDTRLRLKISYDVLVASQRYNEYIPCLKRYLINHVDGRILKIQPHEWIMAAYLPIAIWKKTGDKPGARARTIYQESMRKIRERN